MKSPNEQIRGRIVGYDEKRGELLIRAPYADIATMTRREFKECLVQPIDSRPLSDKQRRACYALLHEIDAYSGAGADCTKQMMKLKFMTDVLQETGEQLFSLSNAPMSLICAFQSFLVRFILDWDIPCSFPLLDFVDDIEDYIYACLANKKCCVCGRHADLHHVDHVGMGRDREEILHLGMRALPLCRKHHTECHTIGQQTFEERYHLNHGIELDKSLCRIYRLKKE